MSYTRHCTCGWRPANFSSGQYLSSLMPILLELYFGEICWGVSAISQPFTPSFHPHLFKHKQTNLTTILVCQFFTDETCSQVWHISNCWHPWAPKLNNQIQVIHHKGFRCVWPTQRNLQHLDKKCFRYNIPIYFIQQNDLFSSFTNWRKKVLTGYLENLGQCCIV